MKILFYSVRDFERSYLTDANKNGYSLTLTEKSLSPDTVADAFGFNAVSVFTGDDVSAPVLKKLYTAGIRYIAVRAAGYDNIDLDQATALGIHIANVPDYSPYAIAEHALSLILALNRKLILADKQVHLQNFTVENLIGFDIHGKTVGIIGTGKIGSKLIRILHGFGCRLLAYDILPNDELVRMYGVEYVPLDALCREADIISIHTCLTSRSKSLINKQQIALMKTGVMLINTSRGGCVNTADVAAALETGHIGYFGADVYEKEKGLFFHDHTGKELNDELLKKLLTMPNVLITPHQAFATRDALANIASTTFETIACWADNGLSKYELLKGYSVTAKVGATPDTTCTQKIFYYDRQSFN